MIHKNINRTSSPIIVSSIYKAVFKFVVVVFNPKTEA